jgi:hypothetical protein
MYRKIFRYKKIDRLNKRYLRRGREYDVIELSWPSALKTLYEENNTAYALQYRPKLNRRGKSVVILPGLRSRAFCEKGIATSLAKAGFDSFVYILPYHMKRTPDGYKNGELFLSTNLPLSGSAFLQTIKEIRALGDFCPGKEIGLFGISLGAVIMHILMGIDDRFSAGIAISSGGNINRVLWEGFVGIAIKRLLKGRGVTDTDYIDTLKKFNEFLRDFRKDGWRRPDFPWFIIDPLTYSHLNYPRKVVMVNGICDPIIPLQSVFELSRALGNPPLILLPAGHLLMYPFYVFLLFYTRDFFKRNLLPGEKPEFNTLC